jgi:hypothetical protein
MLRGSVEGATWELRGRTIRVRDRAGYVDVAAPIAGLWATRLASWGYTDAAAAVMAGRAAYLATPEGRDGVIVARLACAGCGHVGQVGDEINVHRLPVGDTALCLACGPEGNYGELAAMAAEVGA